MEARLTSPIVETVRFELEKIWSAPYAGLMLILLIMGCPTSSAPMFVEEFALEMVSSNIGGFKILCLIAILTFANSFGKDIEHDVLMGEFTLPVKRGNIFVAKLLANLSMLLLMDLIVMLFSIWITTASISLASAFLIVLVDVATLLLFAAITILMSIVLRSRFGAMIVSIAIYFFESYLLESIALAITIVNPPNLDPLHIMLRLVFSGELTVFMWSITLIHIVFPLALLVFAYFFFTRVLQLD